MLPQVKATIYNYLNDQDFGGGYNSHDTDVNIDNNEISGGQNVDLDPHGAFAKRKGHTLFGNYLGNNTGILGLFAHEPEGGTSEFLCVYDTGIYRYVAGIWTLLTGATLTTNLPVDTAYFPLTAKTYITNGTDTVVKYASGASADQTDTNFKKGKYIVHYKNRLLTSVGNILWYTDLGVDTFSANNYVKVEGDITGLEILFDKVLVFTKRKVFMIQNFVFNGVAAGPEALIPLKTDFGAIYDRTIKKVDNLVYFLGQDPEGLAAVYATDAYNIKLVSLKVSPDLDNLAPSLLTNACAGVWGRLYRLSVTPSGQTVNNKEFLWHSYHKFWYPPYTNNIGGISCYAPFEVTGEQDLYAGSQSDGRIYRLNKEDYDENIDQQYVTGEDSNGAIDANPAKRCAQSFKTSGVFTQTTLVNGVSVYLRKNTGTTTGLTVRIETDNAGVPSGTLADANLTGTIGAFSSVSNSWYTVKFTSPGTLNANTTYWLVIKHTTEGSGNSQYYWRYDGSSPSYANGNGATYASGAWTARTGYDFYFNLFTQSDIDGYADTKAFYLAPQGQQAKLKDVFVTAAASGEWNIQVGVCTGTYNGFDYQDMSLNSGGDLIGSTFTIGSSVLGGAARSEQRIRLGTRGRSFKFRFRNRYANQPFTVYGFRTRHLVETKFR